MDSTQRRSEASGRLLSPHQPAINRNHRAGHIVGQVSRKELDHLGAVLDRPEPPKGDQLSPIAVVLAAAWNDRRHDAPGCDHARRDTVGDDAERPEILRQILFGIN